MTHAGGGDAYMAPFRFAESATIKNLHTAGTITSDGKYSAGIVARTEGTVTIQNCWCSVVINSSKSGDGTHGGIISNFASGTVTITNTLFDGKLLTTNSTNQCGGFIGWANVAPTVSNCLYAPATLGTGETEVLDTYDNQDYEACTFIRPKAKATSSSLVNSYYTRTLNVAQGTDASSMTADQLVTALGSGWEVKNGKVVPIMQKSPSTWPLTGHIITGFTATGGTGGTSNEGYDKLVDGLFSKNTGWTKWGTSTKGTPAGETGEYYWVDFHASEPINVEKYILTTGNDNSPYHRDYQGRNPNSWELKAKANNNDTWTTIATVENSNMGNIAFTDYEFTLDTPGKYQYFRFMISQTTGNDFMQLCELRFKQPIDSKRIESSTISGIQSFYQYTGEAIAINYAVTASDGTSMSDGTDYDVTITKGGNSVTEVKEKGIYELTFTGKGSYSGAKSVTLEVVYEIAIGTATYNSDWYLPVAPSKDYSLAQQIYKEEEIGEAGTITYITFDLAQKDDPDLSMPHVQMFMKNVDKQSFDNETDMVIVGESDKVWEGTLTCSGLGRLKINLDTPFEYDGTSNLLICFYDETAGYQGPNYKFRTHSTTDNTALCYYSTTSVPNLNALSSYDGDKKLCAYRANINLGITQSDCSNPTDISFSNITINSATVTWEGEGNLWKLQYKASNATEWTEVDGLTTNSYNLTGLASTTVYNVRVLTDCGNGKTSGWKKGGAVKQYPWTENFNDYANKAMPICWETINKSTHNTYKAYPYVYSKHLRFSSRFHETTEYDPKDQYAILPEMENLNGKQIRLTAWTASSTEGSTFKIVRMVNPADAATFHEIATQELTATHTEYIFPLSGVEGNYIAIMIEAANIESPTVNVYIDDVIVEDVPSCQVPTNFSAADIMSRKATLSWDANGANAWILAYKAEGDADFTEVNVTSNPYTLKNLDFLTTYTAKVRACCSETEQSPWSKEISFTTKLIAPTNLALTTFTANTATLSWTEGGDAKAWVVAYKAKSDADYTEVNVNSNPFTLTGLTEDQSYEAKVCADYGGDHRSDWSSKVVEFEPTDKLVIGQFSSSNSYNYNVPTSQSQYYGYALTQQIFTKGELGEANTINSIDFFAHEGTESPRNLDIYMVSTDKESFESITDGVSVTTADRVFSGDVTFINNAWTNITLDKSFDYDGLHNVLLVVDDNTGSGETNNYSFRCYKANTYQTLYCYKNGSNPDPTALSDFSFTSRTTSKNQIRLTKPSTSESADVTFAKEGFGTYYNSERDVELPAGMKARIVTSQGNEGALAYETIADGDTEEKTVPAATAMMLQVAPAMSSHTSPIKLVSPAASAISQTNMLHGNNVATTTTGGAKFYKLSYDTNGENIGWYWGAEGGAAFQSGAHKVWLALPSASSRSFFALPEFGETEGIVEIENGRLKVDSYVYDLQGRRMDSSIFNSQSSIKKKGLYIINGKKVVIK